MAGPLWPCMLTHGTILSAPRSGGFQVATSLEHFGAQGLHMFPATTLDNPVSPLRAILQDMKHQQLKQLAGRGVNAAILSAFMYYVLSNIVPAWKVCPTPRAFSWECESGTADNAEDEDNFV